MTKMNTEYCAACGTEIPVDSIHEVTCSKVCDRELDRMEERAEAEFVPELEGRWEF